MMEWDVNREEWGSFRKREEKGKGVGKEPGMKSDSGMSGNKRKLVVYLYENASWLQEPKI